MKFKEKPMVNWYDVGQLASTGMKTVISSLFGNFSDKREIQAASSPNATFRDFSAVENTELEDIWIDYIADLGDGFDSTFTMASLMAQESITFDNSGKIETKRGDILVMGGDEVYPTPEIEEYNNRLKGPYNAAYPWDNTLANKDPKRPRLFAIPGNHDWYDGLTNFTRLFCQGRALGNWLTEQERSYFALKLPNNYWLLGIDVQLNADIDAPQKEYFHKIASEHIQGGDKIILCTAEPTWTYKSWSRENTSDQRLTFFIENILLGKNHNYHGRKDNPAQVVAVVAGDLHHYSRYEVPAEGKESATQMITAGGGGAFTHPTHALKDDITFRGKTGKTGGTTFPSKKESSKLAFKNLLFPFYSRSMYLFFGFFHLLTTWFFQTHSDGTFLQDITKLSLGELPSFIWQHLMYNPMVIILNGLLVIGLVLFTDTTSGKGKLNYIAGGIHALLQGLNYYLIMWGLAIASFKFHLPEPWFTLGFSLDMIIAGGFTSMMIFGIYLLFSSLVLKNHATEAFSSFRYAGYKNFLRFHIHKDGMTIYPIGVKSVPTNWQKISGDKDKVAYAEQDIDAILIEKPIHV